MRDVVLIVVFGAALPFAARQAWIAVVLWTWVSIMNPHRLTWGFAHNLPFAVAAATAALIALLTGRDKPKLHWDPVVIVLILFVGWMCLTTLAAFYPEPSQTQLIKILKIQAMTLVGFAAIRDRRHIFWFLLINVLSIGFYGIKGGIFTITSGGSQRVWGPDGGFIEGNNEIGLAMVTTIPLMNGLRLIVDHPRVRQLLVVMMVLTSFAALGTQSRGALLAISAMGAFFWWRSPKKLPAAITLIVLVILLLAFMPESWEARMRTIGTYEQDGSAMGRIEAWTMCLNLALDHPFLGGGYEIYSQEFFDRYGNGAVARVAHSVYFQLLGEHGFVGLGLYLVLLILAFLTCARVRRLSRDQAEAKWIYDLSGMLQVALIGYTVGSAFLSLAYFDLPYNIMVMILACKYWVLEKRWTGEAAGQTHRPAAPTGRPQASPVRPQ